jgi:Flp pilus assembly protein TadD
MTNSPGQHEVHQMLTLFNQGRYADAKILALAITSRSPSWSPGWKALGAIFKQLGQTADALKAMHISASLTPHDAEVHSNLGAVLHELGRADEAAACCRRAIQLRPNLASAHNNLGIALIDLGQTPAAEKSFRRALELMPQFAAAYFNLHAVLLNDADLGPAINCMEKAVAADPANEERRFFLGLLYDYAGSGSAAAAQFSAIEYGTGLSRARLDAWNYLKSRNDPRPKITGVAIGNFQLAINMAPEDGLVLEFGVRFGTSIRQIASLVTQDIHGFDSFQGLPEQWNGEAKGSYSTQGKLPKVPRNVKLHAGWFENTLPEFLKSNPGPVRLMNIDCDIYSSTKTVLDLLSDRIVPGTMIVFDEYVGNEFWRDDEFKAFQEAVSRYGWQYRYQAFSFFSKQVVVRIE